MKLKGKQLTLYAKIAASLVVVSSLALKAFGEAPALKIDDAIKVGAFIATIFAPVDVSLWLEKFTSKRTDAVPPEGGDLKEGEAPHG